MIFTRPPPVPPVTEALPPPEPRVSGAVIDPTLAVAEVHDAIGRSWESGGWEQVSRLTC